MRRPSYLAVIAISMVAALFTGCAIVELIIDIFNYEYTCNGGTPQSGTTTDFDNREWCTACNLPNDIVVNKRCVPIEYTCENGTKADGSPEVGEPREKCVSCNDNSHIIDEGACEPLQFTELAVVAGTATANTVQVTVTASHDATLRWVVYADDTTAPANAAALIDDVADASTAGIDRSGTSGVSLTATTAHTITDIDGLSANTDYTLYAVITAQEVSILSSALDIRTTAVGVPAFTAVPAAGSITQTTANIAFTVNDSDHDTLSLYWVLYTSEQTGLDAATLKSDATGSGGAFRSGATADTVTSGTQKSLTIGDAANPLTPLTDYHFYALVEDGVTPPNQRLSSEAMFATTGYPFVCQHGIEVPNGNQMTANITNCQSCDDYYRKKTDNSCVTTAYTCSGGMKASGSPNAMDDADALDKNADIEKCVSCNGARWLDGGSEHCIDHGTLDANGDYGVAANGATIICAGLNVGDTFTINGTTYTKRTTTGATNRITPASAATSCTSGVTNMLGLFSATGLDSTMDSDYDDVGEYPPVSGAATFDVAIGHWDTASVTTMRGLFHGASDFNQDIKSWNVSSVTDMSYMFKDATDFDQNIGSWTVSSVTNMNSMFEDASAFNKDIGMWSVSSVTDMSDMFRNASKFNQNIGMWTVSNTTDMSYMFNGATDFDQYIGSWDMSAVENIRNMFDGATSFNKDIGGWDVSKVTNSNQMVSMFFNATSFNQDLSEWCVKDIATLPSFFVFGAPIMSVTAHLPKWGDTSVNSCPINFTSQPAIVGTAAITTNIAVTPSKNGTLYWALYDFEPVTAPTVAMLKAATIGVDNVIDASGSTGQAVDDGTPYTVMLSSLSPGSNYFFYAALESGADSEVSDRLDFTPSTGYAFVCANGEPNIGSDTLPDVNKCLTCDMGYARSGDDCLADSDDDMVADVDDIDDDDDGLIEITSGTQFNNIRYNVAGTTYDDEMADSGAGDVGSSMGCPSTGCNGYELTDNISLSGYTNWSPIGSAGGGPNAFGTVGAFTGILEGNGHTISDLTINDDGIAGIALFEQSDSATFRNIIIDDASITRNNNNAWPQKNDNAVLVGQAVNTNIANVHVSGSLTITGGRCNVRAGGIISWFGNAMGDSNTIVNSSASVDFDTLNDVSALACAIRTGGMLGSTNVDGTLSITNSYYKGFIDAKSNHGSHVRAGGLAASFGGLGNITIQNVYVQSSSMAATMTNSFGFGSATVGALAGRITSDPTVTVTDVYTAVDTISGSAAGSRPVHQGRIVGEINTGATVTATDVFYDNSGTLPPTNSGSGSTFSATGLSTSDMQKTCPGNSICALGNKFQYTNTDYPKLYRDADSTLLPGQ